jgi:hypothetical protein
MRRLRSYRGEIFVVLSLIAVVLLVANLVKDGLVTAELLESNKGAIDAGSKIVTGVLLLVGGLFSYFRFFRGRLLAVRAEVSIQVSVHKSPHDFNLHAIQISMRNVGSSAIWEPEPELWITLDEAESSKHEVVREWSDLPGCDDPSFASVIDTGESVLFFCRRRIPKRVWAVTYQVAVRSASGDIWQSGTTVSNMLEAS